jgi:hypothetical protein
MAFAALLLQQRHDLMGKIHLRAIRCDALRKNEQKRDSSHGWRATQGAG